jgi:hypothetical protein
MSSGSRRVAFVLAAALAAGAVVADANSRV